MDQSPAGSGSSRLGIGGFSVKNPVLVNILMIAVIALGAFSLIGLPQEQFAEVPFFWVNIIVPYPGVSAEDMEVTVTIPIENQFQGIDKLQRIVSVSSEGLSVVRIEFDDGISNDEFRALYQESQTRFSRVRLPDGVLTPVIDDFSSADFLPVIEVIISGDVPYSELRNEALQLRDQILRVRDVGDVDLVGAPERQIILNADPQRLTTLGVTPAEVLRAVQDQNTVVPGGTLTTPTQEFLLRTVGSVSSIQDFGDVIIRRSADTGGMLRVSDVAEVVDGFNPVSPISRYDGERAVSLRVTKVPRGSSVTVVSGTRDIVEQRSENLGDGMRISLFNDSTVQISSSLSVLTSNAVIGLLLLVIILWLFIGFRNAMITAVGVPITFALTFIILDLSGETVNTNTLFGLVLVLGLVVDHAIVIIENSYRLRQQGLPRKDAAILGTNQVVWPVIAATATTIAAFFPLMLIPGTIGKFLRVIPLTVTIALIASTGEALFFLPSHFADWGRDKKRKRQPGWWFAYFRRMYLRRLVKLYRRKKTVLAGALIIAAVIFSLTGTLRQDLFSAEDYSYFTIDITMPIGTPKARTDAVVSEYESVILDKRDQGEIIAIRSSIGTATGGAGSTTNANIAQIIVDLKEQDEGRTRSIDDIISDVQWSTRSIPGPEQVLFRKAQTGPPTTAPISYRVSGDNYLQLVEASREIRALLQTVPGVSNIEDDFTAGSPELQVVINQERTSALGIDAAFIGNYIRARFDGLPAGTFFQDNEEVSVYLRYGLDEAREFDDLAQAVIPTPDGRLIPLSSIASIVQETSPGSIRRVDGKRELTITADAAEDVDLRSVDQLVLSSWEGGLNSRFPGTLLLVGGEFSEFQDLLIDILRIFTLGVLLIYLILGTQFKSYTQPLLILLSVPFAFAGVVLYLIVSGTPLSTTVIYAGVALAGIAVNDAIVLISFINDQRAQGVPVRRAVLLGASTRLRPIILTSLTTIMGLLPTAVGIGGTSVVWGPMASTIIFGLFFSTITTLVIIPMLYGTLYDRDTPSAQKETRMEQAKPVSAPGKLLIGVLAFGLASLTAPQVQAQTEVRQGYPDIFCCEVSQQLTEAAVDTAELREFMREWAQAPGGQASASISMLAGPLQRGMAEENLMLASLRSVTRMQDAQLRDLELRRYPELSLQAAPLYEFSDNMPPNTPQSHTFGFGVGVTSQLPTAGTISLDVSHRSSYLLQPSDDWTWNQSPSVSLTLQQPLFQGQGVIRADHMRTILRNAELSRDEAAEAADDARSRLVLQYLSLLHLRQTILEQRWYAHEQILLLRDDLLQAQRDLDRGLISFSDYRNIQLRLDQLLLQTADVNKELSSLERSLEELYKLPEARNMLLFPSSEAIAFIERFTDGFSLLQQEVIDRIVAHDPSYRSAGRELESALMDRRAGNPADAPRLAVTVRSASSDQSLAESVTGLFTGDSLSVSVSLQVPDIFRRTGTLTGMLADERIVQAEIDRERALRDAQNRAADLQDRVDNRIAALSILMVEYRGIREERQEEEILVSRGSSSSRQLKDKMLDETAAAFRVMQVLRELELLSLELDAMYW